MRDLRDYRIHSRAEAAIITGGSAFNIRAESLRLGDFTAAEGITLLEEHPANVEPVSSGWHPARPTPAGNTP